MNSSLFLFLATGPLAEAISDHWDPPGLLLLASWRRSLRLVVLNGFFVAAEFALVKVRGSQFEALEAEGNRRAAIARQVIAAIWMPIFPPASLGSLWPASGSAGSANRFSRECCSRRLPWSRFTRTR